ncbi:MAG: GAF domain-containing protein [Polyangia bacterium]
MGGSDARWTDCAGGQDDESLQLKQRLAELELVVKRQADELAAANLRAHELRQLLTPLSENGRARASEELQQAQWLEHELAAGTARLVAAPSLEDVLRVVGELLSEAAISSALYSLETDTSGAAVALRPEAFYSRDRSKPTPAARLPLSAMPTLSQALDEPDRVLFFDGQSSGGALGQEEQQMAVRHGVAAGVVLPLRLPDRWVGLITLSWPTPQRFPERERRLLQGLLTSVALAVDNRALLRRTRAALADNQRQRAFLQAILDSLPIGIVAIDAENLHPLFHNETARQMTGHPITPDRSFFEQAQATRFFRLGTRELAAGDELPVRVALRTGQRCQGDFDVESPVLGHGTVEAIAIPIRDEQGRTTACLLTIRDLTERKRAEEERARLRAQDEIIRTQAALLAERSTPLIPISDRIMVMPLIGSIDAERARQMMDALLYGVSKSGARYAILDITGVKDIDTQAANALLGAVRAVRLLGVEGVLTGIRAEVAQTLVGLGVDLAGVPTLSTLQGGIAFASRERR